MTARRNIIIAISAIVVFAAIVGFFITLDVSPQIAYARLFIDAGLAIGLIAVVMAFYREKELPTEGVVHALKSLRDGKFKTRLSLETLGSLSVIGKSINELAVVLDEQHDKQEEIKRNLREELLPSLRQREEMLQNTAQKQSVLFEHSYHPELGPVNSILNTHAKPEKVTTFRGFRDVMPEPLKLSPKANESILNNTLIESNPPKAESEELALSVDVERQEQDLGELYQRFIDAQREYNFDRIEYQSFLRAIEKTKTDLRSSHHCQTIFFDIVKDQSQVALRPKIIRSVQASA